MVDLVIFGTGSTGERAWRAAEGSPDINILCFADNDPRKHGTLLHDRSIVGAEDLATKPCDFVVLASMYRAEIARQLVSLGLPPERVVSADPNQFAETFSALAGGRAPAQPSTSPDRKEGLVRLSGSEFASSARLEDVLTDRIHYACGRNVLPGWTNVDGYDESFPCGEIPADIAGSIFRLDLSGPHPFPGNHFRLGYSEDFIEHIDQREFISRTANRRSPTCGRTRAPHRPISTLSSNS